MRITPLLCASFLTLASSCGDTAVNANSNLDSGYTALSSDKHPTALVSFEAALTLLKPGDDLYLPAKLGQVQALAYIDADKSKSTFLAIPQGVEIGPKDYRSIVTDLTQSAEALALKGEPAQAEHAREVAVSLLETGSKTYPDFEGWQALIKMTGDKANSLGAGDALHGLSNLGYVGDEN